MFAFVLKQIMFKHCCSVDFFITSSFPPFLQLLRKNVVSLKACELAFYFRSKDLNIWISSSLAVLSTGSNAYFTQTARHWSKCLNLVSFPTNMPFFVQQGIFRYTEQNISKYSHLNGTKMWYIYGDGFQAPQAWVGRMLMRPSVTVDVPGLLTGF